MGNTLTGVMGRTFRAMPWKTVTPMDEITRFCFVGPHHPFALHGISASRSASAARPATSIWSDLPG